MSDASPAVSVPAKKKVAAKKPKAAATHPPVAEMVTAAISGLKERKGSSLAAIKKYIAANYKVDVAKLGPFIRRFLKKAVADGKLQQTKGTGASGSFRVVKSAEPKPKKVAPKKPKAKKEKAAKKPKSATPKKPKAKKTATKSPAKKAAKPKTAKKPSKSPKKTTKASKPKTVKKPATKKPAGKKTAAKK